MKTTLNRIAAFLAFTLGAMSVVAGWRAMQGWDPGYSILGWLPVYNLIMGILTVLIPAVLIWREHRFSMPAAIGTTSLHALVFLVLVTAFRGTVAAESVAAMLFCFGLWLVILGLMFLAWRKNT
jgi:hypothetical protein